MENEYHGPKCALRAQVSQSGLILCDPMDCSQPGSFVHGIFQARILEWGAIAQLSNSGTLPLRLPVCLSTRTVLFFLLINTLHAKPKGQGLFQMVTAAMKLKDA